MIEIELTADRQILIKCPPVLALAFRADLDGCNDLAEDLRAFHRRTPQPDSGDAFEAVDRDVLRAIGRVCEDQAVIEWGRAFASLVEQNDVAGVDAFLPLARRRISH